MCFPVNFAKLLRTFFYRTYMADCLCATEKPVEKGRMQATTLLQLRCCNNMQPYEANFYQKTKYK